MSNSGALIHPHTRSSGRRWLACCDNGDNHGDDNDTNNNDDETRIPKECTRVRAKRSEKSTMSEFVRVSFPDSLLLNQRRHAMLTVRFTSDGKKSWCAHSLSLLSSSRPCCFFLALQHDAYRANLWLHASRAPRAEPEQKVREIRREERKIPTQK